MRVQADSPTGINATLNMLLTVAATKGWKIKIGDVKSGYLQGEKLDREVYMVPPMERLTVRVLSGRFFSSSE